MISALQHTVHNYGPKLHKRWKNMLHVTNEVMWPKQKWFSNLKSKQLSRYLDTPAVLLPSYLLCISSNMLTLSNILFLKSFKYFACLKLIGKKPKEMGIYHISNWGVCYFYFSTYNCCPILNCLCNIQSAHFMKPARGHTKNSIWLSIPQVAEARTRCFKRHKKLHCELWNCSFCHHWLK